MPIRLRKSFLALLLIAILGLTAGFVPAPVAGGLADPQKLPPTGVPWLDQIYYGEEPTESDDKPVLVFVHGAGGLAEDWWKETEHYGVNDMYATAFNVGYRTAFVDLNENGTRWPIETMWVNGRTLARQIKAIADYYGVETVDVVSHSKGGVDAQTAIVYFGAASFVRNVFTLSSPHWGTPIADLAFKTRLGGWLADVIGMLTPGTFTMTTAYMRFYRAVTDRRTVDDNVNYYWAAGTDWGPKRTALRLSGRWLDRKFGPNDGVIPVERAELPGDNSFQLFVGNFNHDNIRMGGNSFEYIDAVIQSQAGP